jgi:hypothetical protein
MVKPMPSFLRHAFAAAFLLLALSFAPARSSAAKHRFVVANGRFELDGKSFQIISGGLLICGIEAAQLQIAIAQKPRGITAEVPLTTTVRTRTEDDIKSLLLRLANEFGNGPTPYRGIGRPTDTFLDMRAYGKGQVWVNGRALGHYWRIGPGGLNLPGAWLHSGRNEVVLLDLDGGSVPPLAGIDHALIDEPIRAERAEPSGQEKAEPAQQ